MSDPQETSLTEGGHLDDDIQIQEAEFTQPNDESSIPEILACLSVSIVNIQAGLILTYSAILIPELKRDIHGFAVTPEEASWIGSIVGISSILGAIIGGFLMEVKGRVFTVQVNIIPHLLSWIIIAFAQNVTNLFWGRFIAGIAIAIGPNAAPVYVAEVSKPSSRGSLMSTNSMFITIGSLIVLVQGYFIRDWRTNACLFALYGVIPHFAIFLWSPKSPMWLVWKKQNEKALESLKFLKRMDQYGLKSAKNHLNELIAETKFTEAETTSGFGTYLRQLLNSIRKPQTYKPFWIIVVIFLLQQFAGVTIITAYTVSFFEAMKCKEPYFGSILITSAKVFSGILASYVQKIWGRRKTSIISCSGMAISMFLLGYCIQAEVEHVSSMFKWIPVCCMLIYTTSSSVGMIQLPWILCGELFPNEVRSIIQGPLAAWGDFTMFAALKSYFSMEVFFGAVYRVHLFFGCVALVAIIFVWLFVPETHNQKLNQIEDYFCTNTIYILSRKTERLDTKDRDSLCEM